MKTIHREIPRQITQIAAGPSGADNMTDSDLYALANDGTVWYLSDPPGRYSATSGAPQWQRLPDLPQEG